MADEKHYSNIVVKELPDSEVEIEGEISAELLERSRAKAVRRLSESLEIPGFRKGHVPEKVIVDKIGDYPVLEDAAEIALTSEYPKILEEHKIDALGRPEISITKLALGNPLGFKLKTAVMPAFALPDYKKIASEKNAKANVEGVGDKDVEEAVEQVRRNKAHYDLHQKLGKDTHDHDHAEIKEEDLPKVDDEFVKTLGNYANVEDFKAKVRESLVREKEYQAREKTRLDIIEEILNETKMSVPEVLVRSELDKLVGQFKDDVARSGMEYESYLKEVKKTEDDLRKEWRESAVKKAKFQLILNRIAGAEGIAADKEMLDHETESLQNLYKDADPNRVRIYVESILTNEKVLKFLESIGKGPESKD